MNKDDNDRLRRLIRSEEETQKDLDPAPQDSGTTASRKKTGNTTPILNLPDLDENNMPLPRRVEETDMEGTRVTNAAYDQAGGTKPPGKSQPQIQQRPNYRLPENQSQPRPQRNPYRPAPLSPTFADRMALFFGSFGSKMRGNKGCLLRGLVVSFFAFVLLGLCGGSILVYRYYEIASALPDVGDLKNRTSQFQTTRILDRNGQVLFELNDPNAGRRNYIPLSEISPYLVAATIATEDKDFYDNPGFDPIAIMRALWVNYVTEGQGGGASTVTQQLARALLLSPEERSQRTVERKTREIILAAEITRRYTKDEILELYLNEIYYGNLAYGIEAAANTYFNKSAQALTLGEAAFLAGLPQSPAVYDIYTNPEATLTRQKQVLALMFELSQLQGCIEVSNSPERVCVDPVAATNASHEMENYNFIAPVFGGAKYPHWVNFVRAELEELYDAQTIYRSGFVVYTTLDPVLQDQAQQLVTNQVAGMAANNTKNGALVAIQPSTGQILAMVGSPDFNNAAISGQINMAISPTRQPGSSIKPITYVAAFEKGWTPSTWIWDVPTQFPDGANPPYEPRNYDGKFHGGMTVRIALSNSFNIPAVKALEFVGIYDNPETPEKEGMIAMAERLGIASLTRGDYGLSLTLGGGDVSLMDMTSAYAVFANGGVKIPPVAILKITSFNGEIIYEYQAPAVEQVIRAEHAYLISSILSDNQARSLMFGSNSALNLSFQVAAKTGTTNDIRDNWTLGYTPDLVTGVWVGNADYTPMVSSTGLSGAAPIWSQFMEFAVPYLTNGSPTPFSRPPSIMDKVVCRLGGAEPSNLCKSQYTEVFASDQPPLPEAQDLLRRIKLDLWTGYQASDACSGPTAQKEVINVKDPWARKWLESGDGRGWLEDNGLPEDLYYAPERECQEGDPQPQIELNFNDGQTVSNPILEVNGTASAEKGFKSWRLEFGSGEDPGSWTQLAESDKPIEDGTLTVWNLTGLPNGIVTLRLTLIGENAEVDKRIRLNLSLPIPTVPSSTPTATATLTPTETPTQVIIIPPTDTPTLTPFPTDTPTETPTPP
ncbi:MAG: Monofunctional biosynthetic peptidoglycan transglycosylase [Anaerolineales bacterium]|nr:Monofunctional biosynthetic peptidoglycan transglycosylase [Anaerolineales bacterium]